MSAGRHSQLTDDKLERILTLAQAGVPQSVIADDIGVAVGTLSKWLKWGDDNWQPKEGQECPADRDPYRVFRDRYRNAQAKPIVMCEATWMQAVRGKPAVKADKEKGIAAQPAIPGCEKAAERWLRLHRPDLYREQTDINVDFGDRQAAMDAWRKSILDMDRKPDDGDDDE